MLTQARLMELLRYDDESGEFFWKVRTGGTATAGRRAGTVYKDGHSRITINYKSYKKSAVVHLYKTGAWPKKPTGELTQHRLKELLHYDPDTGLFTRRRGGGGKPAGSKVGTISKGYIFIAIDGRKHTAGRLAWLYMIGEWPKTLIDHRNTNKSDNRWENLREATKSENGFNRGLSKRNTTGYKGVFRKRLNFESRIMINGICIRLGTFVTPEEASAAYEKAAREYHGDYKYDGD